MQYVNMYRCEYCKKLFNKESDCLAHEASIFNLSASEYSHWLKLQQEARHAHPGFTVNDKTRAKYDEAINAVLEFERQHQLDDAKIEALAKAHAEQHK